MKVKELMELLKTFDPELDVAVWDPYYDCKTALSNVRVTEEKVAGKIVEDVLLT